jgi:tripartite-type tricarboxylate transporter receptor subunit TctC
MLKLPRRQFLHLAAGAAVLPAMPRFANAQTYPSRPVRLVVGFGAGSASDIYARLIAQWLSERLGQPFVVENRPGAGGNIGTAAVVNAPPDGYTLLMVASANAVNATLYDKLNFDFLRDIAPVAGPISNLYAMVVNPVFPAKTVPEFIAYAKANPGRINMGSSGVGSVLHLSGELFKLMTGVDMVHVPNRSGTQLADLIGGQVQLVFSPLPSTVELIAAGKLRALAVSSVLRWPTLPDVPTLNEFVPGYEARGWNGIGAPKNTPTEIIDKLNRETNAAFANPAIKTRLAELSATAFTGTPEDFKRYIAEETEKWGKVVRAANLKAE